MSSYESKLDVTVVAYLHAFEGACFYKSYFPAGLFCVVQQIAEATGSHILSSNHHY